MKNLLITAFLLVSLFSYSQLWFDIGAKGGIGTGFLINKMIADDDRLSVTPGMNYFYGGKFGVNFGKQNSITFDVSYGNNSYSFIQTDVSGIKEAYNYNIHYSALTLAPLYRRTTDAQYLEIGPEFSFFKKGDISDMANPNVPISAEDHLNARQIGAVFGFGGYIVGNEVIALSMGIRFHYVITDLVSDTYSSSNYPFSNYPDITTHSSTNPLSVQAVFELNYSLAQLARASCGKRVALISF